MKIGQLVCALSVFSAAMATNALAADTVIGKVEFGNRCAICHGEDGTGSGTVAEMFKIPPSDLTQLSERAGGEFPFSEVYQWIDGRKITPAHGDAEMPIWGEYFHSDSLEDRGFSSVDAEQIVQGRILSLVYYLQTIQK